MSPDTQELLAMSSALKASSRALIRRSRWLIMSSCERLVGRRPRIRGGGDSRLDEGEVRQRVRALLSRGILPGIRPHEIQGEESPGQQDCTICGVMIGKGEVGFGVPPPNGVVVLVHRRCFDLWSQEAAARVAETDQV